MCPQYKPECEISGVYIVTSSSTDEPDANTSTSCDLLENPYLSHYRLGSAMSYNIVVCNWVVIRVVQVHTDRKFSGKESVESRYREMRVQKDAKRRDDYTGQEMSVCVRVDRLADSETMDWCDMVRWWGMGMGDEDRE